MILWKKTMLGIIITTGIFGFIVYWLLDLPPVASTSFVVIFYVAVMLTFKKEIFHNVEDDGE